MKMTFNIVVSNCIFILATIIIFLISPDANATCTASSGNITFPSVNLVKRDAPNGTVIATGQLITSISCNNSGASGASSWNIMPSTGTTDYGPSIIAGVRQSAFPGVGIRWTNSNSTSGTTVTWSDAALNAYTNGGQTIALSGTTSVTDTFELVKIGPVASQSLFSQVFGYQYIPTGNSANRSNLFDITLPPTNLLVLGCDVTQSTIPVPLGNDIQANIFTGPGSTSTDVPFSIALNCDNGVRVSFQLDGTDSGTPGVLALNNDSDSATGIGVQVLYKGNPVTFGTVILDGLITSAGDHNIDFLARYYQTGNSVTGGPANATATFTMTYN
ncbi:fimbrial protein [Hafnia paralvei]|jgi:type 1 fimbria pilin|uniref:fimbrial protein n=2 Tax=Hafnia paralvei TaxID=546367 RepID=UPI0015854556|nr:fimbrial protein [Hafnia paralvei]MCE9909581.1 fimbrial protein [Hafnia paralvei]MCE9912576.1 fimbrial protein [Hafnia paralvei]MDX6910579.1 fimbrial protein [Hafnia paralvei]NUN41622.1 fimbrial protein [Hafnia paralvei]